MNIQELPYHDLRLIQAGLVDSGLFKGKVDGKYTAALQTAYNKYADRNSVVSVPVETVESLIQLDARSEKNIKTLHPKAQPLFRRLVLEGKRIAKELGATDLCLISGNRTYAEQDKLYAQGRTSSGQVVTNARGGYSNHNFAIAGDCGVFGPNATYLDAKNPVLASKVYKALAAWVKVNLPELEWGGDWKSFKDEPHFEVKTGLTTAQKRARVASGTSIL